MRPRNSFISLQFLHISSGAGIYYYLISVHRDTKRRGSHRAAIERNLILIT